MNTINPAFARYQAPPKSASSATESRCPHGAPSGTCPYCHGMGGGGGGGGGSNKPAKLTGLLTWNEAYALWKSIQNAKLQAEDNQQARQAASEQQALETRQALRMPPLATTLIRLVQTVAGALTVLFQTGSRTAGSPAQEDTGLIDQLRNRAQLLANRLLNITDKLATLIGEELKLLRENLQARLQKLLRDIVTGRFAQLLSMIAGVQEKVFQTFFQKPFRELRRRFYENVRIFSRSQKQ